MPQVKVRVHRNGELAIEGEGFQGKSCANVIDRLVAAAGGDPDKTAHEWKPEAYAAEETGEQVGNG